MVSCVLYDLLLTVFFSRTWNLGHTILLNA